MERNGNKKGITKKRHEGINLQEWKDLRKYKMKRNKEVNTAGDKIKPSLIELKIKTLVLKQ